MAMNASMGQDHHDEQMASRREENIKALLNNNLQVQRQPLLSKYLIIKEGEQTLRKAFKSPAPGAPALSDALRKRLLARKHFVPWGANKPFTTLKLLVPIPQPEQQQQPGQAPEDITLPPGIEPLVLWDPTETGLDTGEQAVAVDPMLTRWLRPHQREGVQFMFDCVTGLRLSEGQGCILADDMGLGKTLQGITLMWTLLQQGSLAVGGVPIAKRAIIVCPTSLVSNWDTECTKWLKGRCRTQALCESSRDDVIDAITRFTAPNSTYHCLIISYETFRLHAQRLTAPGSCDLLIADEAHRLKNDATLTNRALDSLPCRRRVLLSGTPMQNHLDEFFAMVDFCNPGVLGSPAEFRKHFEAPILAGREPGTAPEVAALGEARSSELSALVNNFILRRTNKLLSDHLPPKVVQVVCCRLTPLQRQLYEHFLLSNATRRLLSGSKATGVLSAITCLKKLCNHPKLIYDTLHSKAQPDGTVAEGFEGVGELFPPGLFDSGRPGRGEMALGWEELSGKMGMVARLLAVLRETSNDKVVIVSNYTQTLDLFAVLCRQRGYQFVRLDGSTSITKRQKLVQQLNAPGSQVFVFLLSSKAGGCGLNLVGANRLILFDPDWNPATDKQAAARVWRDGQKKRVYVYRLLSAGTIEEKVFQRQISKEGLQQVVDNAAAAGGGEDAGSKGGSNSKGQAAAGSSASGTGPNVSLMSTDELRQLFSLRSDVASDTYEVIQGGSERAAAAAAAASAAVATQARVLDASVDVVCSDSDDWDDFREQNNKQNTHKAPASSTVVTAAPQGDSDKGSIDETTAAAAAQATGGAGPNPAKATLAMTDGHRPQIGQPSEEDLQHFGHHTAEALSTIPDEALQASAGEDVTFVFSCQVAGRLDVCEQQPAAAAATSRQGVGAIGAKLGPSNRPSSILAAGRLCSAGGAASTANRPRHSAPAAITGKRPLAATIEGSNGSEGQHTEPPPVKVAGQQGTNMVIGDAQRRRSAAAVLSGSSCAGSNSVGIQPQQQPEQQHQHRKQELPNQQYEQESQQQQASQPQQVLAAVAAAEQECHTLADAGSRLNSMHLQDSKVAESKQAGQQVAHTTESQQHKRQRVASAALSMPAQDARQNVAGWTDTDDDDFT